MKRTRRIFTALIALGLSLALGMPVSYAASVPSSELTSALHWRNVGPFTGGRVTTVAGVPGEPSHFYAGYAGGGVWETEDYGHNWKPLTDKYFKPDTGGTVGAMAVAPSNPKIIYVGTGDSGPRNTVLTGHGMYKSTDAGKTWSYIGLGKTHIISWIIVDPNNPDVVYVAALGHLFGPNPERGVYKTTDGGKTWNKILYVNDHTGAITLAMDPKNPEVLYASMWQMMRRMWTFSSGGPGSGIYKSTDGGAHWTNITHNQGLPSGIFGKVGIAVAPSEPNVVYALIQADYKPGKPGGLFRSENGGQSWKLMNDSLEITQRAFYYMRVFVDPKDANTIYLPNVGLQVSHDGGKTLATLRPPHGDNHAVWINPNNPQLFVEGNDGGATVTQDGGKTWSSEDNQPTGQFYHANLDDQFPFWIYGAQQDRGSVGGPSAVRRGGIPPVWTSMAGGEESWLVPAPGQPWITIGQSYYGRIYREDRKTGVVAPISPWPAYQFGSQASQTKYRYGWIYGPMVFAPGDANKLLLGANVLFESNDLGDNWRVISPDLTRNDKSKQQRPGGPISADVTSEEAFDTISSIAFSPLNQNIIWTGSDDGLVHVTTDGGAHWSEVRPPKLPTWATITCVEPSHTEAGTAYVSASRFMWDDFHPYVYKTTDYGKHWTEITTGLPDDQYVQSVRQDPNDPNLMFVGTSATVYMSLDGGAHWQPLSLNLPAVRVSDIEFQPQQHALAISTFGRAFWVLDNVQYLEQLTSAEVSGDAPHLFKPQQTWLVMRRTSGFGGQAAPNTGANRPTGAAVFFYLPADYSGQSVKLSFTTADGKLIRSFKLPQMNEKTHKPEQTLHPGVNHFQWNLRYPNAVDIKGVYHSGFGAAEPVGPEVVPGTYDVVLNYAGTTQTQSFVVKLDPRLTTTQAQLQQRFDLLMQIHQAVGNLGAAVNQALDARDQLQQAVTAKKVSAERAHKASAALTRDIDGVVNFKIKSGEGGLVYQPRLRAWLTFLVQNLSMEFLPPTHSQQQVAAMYFNETRAAVARLHADVADAKSVLGQ